MAEQDVTTEKKPSKPKKAPAAKPAAAAKPAVKKAAAPKKTAAAKPAVKETKTNTADLELRYRMVEVAAYFIAEKDGFAGNPVDYWIAAEAEISQA